MGSPVVGPPKLATASRASRLRPVNSSSVFENTENNNLRLDVDFIRSSMFEAGSHTMHTSTSKITEPAQPRDDFSK